MKSVFSSGEQQVIVANEIQKPVKDLLQMIGEERDPTARDAFKVIKLLKSLMSLKKATRENTSDHGIHILLDIKDDCFKHFNIPKVYRVIYEAIINYAIGKLAFDNWYRGVGDRWYGEMIRRGYPVPGQNRPSSVLWNILPPATRARMGQSIIDNYQLLQDRLLVIDGKLGGQEAKIHRDSRFEQFANRILTDFEREVIAWK